MAYDGPPNPDPLLEGKYAHARTLRDMAGAFLVGIVGFFLLLGVATLVVGLVR